MYVKKEIFAKPVYSNRPAASDVNHPPHSCKRHTTQSGSFSVRYARRSRVAYYSFKADAMLEANCGGSGCTEEGEGGGGGDVKERKSIRGKCGESGGNDNSVVADNKICNNNNDEEEEDNDKMINLRCGSCNSHVNDGRTDNRQQNDNHYHTRHRNNVDEKVLLMRLIAMKHWPHDLHFPEKKKNKKKGKQKTGSSTQEGKEPERLVHVEPSANRKTRERKEAYKKTKMNTKATKRAGAPMNDSMGDRYGHAPSRETQGSGVYKHEKTVNINVCSRARVVPALVHRREVTVAQWRMIQKERLELTDLQRLCVLQQLTRDD